MQYHIDPDLEKYGARVRSQNDEDGILTYLFSVIPGNVFVEIGVGPGEGGLLEGNCVRLREQGWVGAMFDLRAHCDVVAAHVTPDNVNALIMGCGGEYTFGFDLLSIDIDGQDLWIWEAVLFRPFVVVIEYNAGLGGQVSVSVPRNDVFRWDGTRHFGASLRALEAIGVRKGYVLVYANGVNAFFVWKDILANPEDFQYRELYRRGPEYPECQLERPWVQIQ